MASRSPKAAARQPSGDIFEARMPRLSLKAQPRQYSRLILGIDGKPLAGGSGAADELP